LRAVRRGILPSAPSCKDVTLRELVEKSGLSKGAFYHYFPSKERLFIETTERFLINTFKIDLSTKNIDSMTFRDLIQRYVSEGQQNIEQLVKSIGGKVKETNFYMYLFQAMEHYPGFKKKVETFHEEEINFIKKFLDMAKDRKEIKNSIDTADTAQLIHTLMHGISVISNFSVKSTETKKFAERMLKNLYSLIET